VKSFVEFYVSRILVIGLLTAAMSASAFGQAAPCLRCAETIPDEPKDIKDLEVTLTYHATLPEGVAELLELLSKFRATYGRGGRTLHDRFIPELQTNLTVYVEQDIQALKTELEAGENGGMGVETGSFSIPNPNDLYGKGWVAVEGGFLFTKYRFLKLKKFFPSGDITFVFREVQESTLSGLKKLQLFGWFGEGYLPSLETEARAKAFINTVVGEPKAIDSMRNSIEFTNGLFSIVLPGYTGYQNMTVGGKPILGFFQWIGGLASLGLFAKWDGARKIAAWTIIGASGAAVGAAIFYEPPLQTALEALPAVFAVPFVVKIDLKRIVGQAMIAYEVTFGGPSMARFANKTREMVIKDRNISPSVTEAILRSDRIQKISLAVHDISKLNQNRGLGWIVPAEELKLAIIRIEGILDHLDLLKTKDIVIPYLEALKSQFHFARTWGAMNKHLVNVQGPAKDLGHNVISDLLMGLLPDKKWLNQTELDKLLIRMIKEPLAVKADMDKVKNWKGLMNLTVTDEFAAAYSGTGNVRDAFFEAIKGMLLSTKRVGEPLYRLTTLKNPGVFNVGNLNHYPGPRATGPTKEGVAVFANQFDGRTEGFVIMRIKQPTIVAAGPGEGHIKDLGTGLHGMMVENERVALLGEIVSVSSPKCYVKQTIKTVKDGVEKTTEIEIPVVDVVLKSQ
jgi:hypothetical protein